jgi:hypothetical protein
VGLANLGSESETCVGSRVHLVGVFISFEKNFYWLLSLSPSLVRRIGPSASHIPNSRFTNEAWYMKCLCGKKKLSLLYKVSYTLNIHDDKWIFDPK